MEEEEQPIMMISKKKAGRKRAKGYAYVNAEEQIVPREMRLISEEAISIIVKKFCVIIIKLSSAINPLRFILLIAF